MMLGKPLRVSDESVLKSARLKPCVACGNQPSDPAHIYSRGSGGPDVGWNIMPLCRIHHSEQHKIGWATFARRHWSVFEALLIGGWELCNGKLIHPRESHG